ncbi:MAG: tetratricopeptide repeat protein [Flavobacteriaceae bacterium]|nr:tetratricopeptide repeat protein [Bacteroidia bacterium]NNK88359.1 tetratricopeptide repeat protein [Flavobacteriaceae bacterium]
MNRYKKAILFLVFLGSYHGALGQVDFNQTPDDDLGNIEDKFQEFFFEALKQKGIENYDRAIIALQKCLNLDDSEAVVHFEMGKNYVQLKNYGAAEGALKKALALDPDNEWYLDELYGVYVEMKDFDRAIETVQQLVEYHPDYKEDLANLYYRGGQFKKALELLDELDDSYGVTKSREELRHEIYNATGSDQERIDYLEKRIIDNPDNEYNYLNLIYRYSAAGNETKALETAEKLRDRQPDSQLVHLALYKFYLDDGKEAEAIESMKIVLKSPAIKPEAKARVLNDFVKFVQANPKYEAELLEVTTAVVDDKSGKSDAEMAQYYLQNDNKDRALEFFKKALGKDPGNFDLLKNMLLLLLDVSAFEEAAAKSKESLDSYPSQPVLYLINGVALNFLKRPKEAISVLEIGVDYIIDDPVMTSDFYKQLSLAYKLDNNIERSQAFEKMAQEVLNNND